MNMRRSFIFASLAILSLVAVSCSGGNQGQNNVAAGDAAEVAQLDSARTLGVDSLQSSLSWKGFKPGGEHFGKLPVSEGSLDLKDGVLRAGAVVIRLDGLTVEDIKPEEGGDQLRAHLLNEDFFDAGQYPEVRFELTDVPADGLVLASATELKGNLTIKNVTKNISIPLESVQHDEATGVYTIKSKTFSINRADWGVKYGSKSFFTGLGDKFINDDIELSFLLKTK